MKHEQYTSKSIFANLNDYCILAKEHDYIELTEWRNGEGLTVDMNDNLFQLTWGQLKALKKLSKKLTK